MNDKRTYSAIPVGEILEVVIQQTPTPRYCKNFKAKVKIGEEIYSIFSHQLCKKCGEKGIRIGREEGMSVHLNGKIQ